MMDVRDRIRDLVDQVPPPPPVDPAAIVRRGHRRRARRVVAVGGVSLAALAIVVFGASVLPDGTEPRLPAIGDTPDTSMDPQPGARFELGDSYLWRPTTPGEDADATAVGFARDVLGWDEAAVTQQRYADGDADVPARPLWLSVAGPHETSLELYLQPYGEQSDAWQVTEVKHGVAPAFRMEVFPPILHWQTLEHDGASGTAYVRTADEGGVQIPVEPPDVQTSSLSLDGHLDVERDPLRHEIQTILLVFHDRNGEVTSAVGDVWLGTEAATEPATDEGGEDDTGRSRRTDEDDAASDDAQTDPSPSMQMAQEIIDALLRFAAAPGPDTAGDLPFADEVALGLGDEVRVTRGPGDLADADAWVIEAEVFRAYAGPFSALDLLAGVDPADTVVSLGEHPHCVSPPQPPPPGFADHDRISVQPDLGDDDSCLSWWTVDLYLRSDGRIDALTLDLFEP